MKTMYPGNLGSNQDEGGWQKAGLFGNTICLNRAYESGRETVFKKLRRKIFNLGMGPIDYDDVTNEPCPTFKKCEACPNRQMNKADSLGRVAINFLGVLRVGAGEIGKSLSMVRRMASQVIRSSNQGAASDSNPDALIGSGDNLYGSRDVQPMAPPADSSSDRTG